MASAKILRVHGTEVRIALDNDVDQRFRDIFGIEQKSSVLLDAARGEVKEVEIQSIENDDVLEIEFEGGFHLFARRDDYERDFPIDASRGVGDDQLALPDRLDLGSPSRGAKDWLVKALDVFGVRIAETSGVKLAQKFESSLVPKTGMFQLDDAESVKLSKTGSPVSAEGTKPLLVFIHGTASNTDGSFSGLWEPRNNRLLDRLFRCYMDRVYAFEHCTLTQSPIENACQLLDVLPNNAKLHLVSHSRGGLVGELLSKGKDSRGNDPFPPDELQLFADRASQIVRSMQEDEGSDTKLAYTKQGKHLSRLNELLKQKNITVERFVRVACPARGTTLASGRLDRWLSVFFNLVGLVPALGQSPYYALLKNFIVALVKTRTKPHHLPGLEAQMPGSPLITLLNNSEGELAADLSVISGDLEKDGLLGRLAMFLPDRFYDTDHDLVVNTPSMYGGGERADGERYYFDQGPEVHHFNYFRNNETASRVVEGLTAKQGDLEKFFDAGLPVRAGPIPSRAYKKHSGPQPVVFVLPGIMGSELDVNDKNIWAHKRRLLTGGMRRLRIQSRNVSSDGLISEGYESLVDYLSETHEVIPFHYDWRTSLVDNRHDATVLAEAVRLAEAVKSKLDEVEAANQPVRILAHSMGGLLARIMIAKHQLVWEEMMRHPGSRFVMLGTPNGGSYAIPRMLLGQDRLIKQLALLDLKHSQEELLKIIVCYPGVLNMLPETGGGVDLLAHDTWLRIADIEKGRWPVPAKTALEQAREFRSLLNSRPLNLETQGKVVYVAGHADETPMDLQIQSNKLVFKGTPRGDGRVPWNTGIPAGIPVYYMDAVHGDMANYTPAFSAIAELLDNGRTNLLSERPPAVSRGVKDLFDMESDEVERYPDMIDLLRAGTGGTDRRSFRKELETVELRVTHGSLAFSRNPVAVGHYEGDGLFSAENYLDRCLDHRLMHRHDLGLYPGELETCDIVLNTDNRKPRGAIVVGLGQVGKLTMSRLTRTFSHALRTYAIRERERSRASGKHSVSRPGLEVTTLLIGASAGGLPVADSLKALLDAVLMANRMLADKFPQDGVCISELEIMELWEDKVILTMHALERIFDTNDTFHNVFRYNKTPDTVDGAQFRAFHEEERGWWRRLQIRSQDNGTLSFNAITDLARTELTLMVEDRTKVDDFLNSATERTSTRSEVSKTLFELLLPNALKEKAADGGDTILILNESAARYPWELLEDRWTPDEDPVAVTSRVVRQLESIHFRRDPNIVYRNNALIVGEPKATGWSPLPGAAAEAETVWSELNRDGRFKADKVIYGHANEILKALHASDYRILHLTGHGAYDYEIVRQGPQCDACGQPVESKMFVTGMVIGEDILLTPADIEQMRHVPELVFINCCYLGKTEQAKTLYPSLAANLSTQFVRMGVRAVIAAGWEVHDSAAQFFAAVFYASMLAGEEFGEAVKAARKQTYDQYPGINTWGAYQCYGDPHFKLVDHAPSRSRSFQKPITAGDFMARMHNIAGIAGTATDSDINRLKDEVDFLVKQAILAKWIKRGDVCAAAARAYGELDRFDESIEWYKTALEKEDSGVTVRNLEQLANLDIRQALKEAMKHPDRARLRTATRKIRSAIKTLKNVKALAGETSERLVLLGSAYKRLVVISSLRDEPVGTSLENMQRFYGEASSRLEEDNKGDLDPYSYTNFLTARVLNRLIDATRENKPKLPDAQELKTLQRMERDAEHRDKENPGFWTLISGADCALVYSLAVKDLDKHWEDIAERYIAARTRAATPREFRSVIEHMDFLAIVLDPGEAKRKGSSSRAKAFDAVTRLRGRLVQAIEDQG